MTRKSPPTATRLQLARQRAFGQLLLTVAVSSCAVGCSLISPGKSSLTDYEATRRAIENPVSVTGGDYGDEGYRPEGVSAERERGKTDFLRRIGLRAERRRDIDVAKREYEAGEKLLASAKAATDDQRPALLRQAAEKFVLAAKNWKSSGLEQNALLNAAECHFFAEDYYESEELYA
ncbi:MAG: hypothetical protein R3C53_10215 [Pirellulaceae bacterium]